MTHREDDDRADQPGPAEVDGQRVARLADMGQAGPVAAVLSLRNIDAESEQAAVVNLRAWRRDGTQAASVVPLDRSEPALPQARVVQIRAGGQSRPTVRTAGSTQESTTGKKGSPAANRPSRGRGDRQARNAAGPSTGEGASASSRAPATGDRPGLPDAPFDEVGSPGAASDGPGAPADEPGAPADKPGAARARGGEPGAGGRAPGFGRTGGSARQRATRPGGGRGSAASEFEADADADPVVVAREICLRLLTERARTRQELAQALCKRGVPDEAATVVLERFDEVGLIDDAAFAGQWVRSRHARRGLARRAIAMELRQKGVADEVAQEALAEVDTTSEERRARELVDRKLRTVPADTPEQRTTAARRLVGMLARRGYSGGISYRVVREALAAHGAGADELGIGPDD